MYTQTPPAQRPATIHDGLAVASLVLSILWLGGLGALLAIIMGHASRGAAKRQGRPTSSLATAGALIGWLGLILAVILIIALIAAAHSADQTTQNYINCINNQVATGYPSTC